jgi:hypothetical protein
MVSAFTRFKENSYEQLLLRKFIRMSGERRESVFTGKFTLQFFLRKIARIWRLLRDVLFTDIGRTFLLAVLPEENHENLSALKEVCGYSYSKKVYIGNSLRKVTRISKAQRKDVCTGFWRNYIVILQEENHENLRAVHGFCVHWH